MQLHLVVAGLAAYGSLVTAQTLHICPGAEITYNTVDRTIYSICRGTQYDQPTLSKVVVTDYKSCAERCKPTSDCDTAVYEIATKLCHLKGKGKRDSSNWLVDDRFMAIRAVGTVDEGTVITSCPWSETPISTSDGVARMLCPNTDIQMSSIRDAKLGSAIECSDSCSKTSGCVSAVWDRISSQCYLKGNGSYKWVVSTRSDTIRRFSNLPERSTIDACTTLELPAISPNGKQFGICEDSDYEGPSKSAAPSPDLPACIERCGESAGCVRGVYDNVGKICHLKGAINRLTWKTSKKYSSFRFVGQNEANSQSRPGGSDKIGRWSEVIRLPIVPVQGIIIPEFPVSNRLLVFSSHSALDWGGDGKKTQFADYNWASGAVSQREVANTQHDMFCPGMSFLGDGRMLITGGSSNKISTIYDPTSNSFSRGADMNIPRGYQASVTLSDGRVYTIGGSWSGGEGGKYGEIYDPSRNSWTKLNRTNADPIRLYTDESPFRADNHAWLFGWKNNSVFQAGPSKRMNWFDGTGQRPSVRIGTRGDTDEMCGIFVMYDTGKILAAGGSPKYTESDAVKVAYEITIGDAFAPITTQRVSDMSFARGFSSAAVLPDGTVFVVGGQKRSQVFTDIESALSPEIYDPATKRFTVMAAMRYGRNYHSIALLLADGTVFSGGGGLCYVQQGTSDAGCDRATDHPDGQIFSPPYLFNDDGTAAMRPIISNLSNTKFKAGATVSVTMSNDKAVKFSLIRIGSSTHSVNTDQRRISIGDVKQNGNVFTLGLPSDYGVLIPGYYYLFAVNAAGVPCIARTVQILLP